MLALVGDGSLRNELERLAAEEGVGDRVVFLGDRSDVRNLLPGLDVFAMSSVSEGYSIALLEASAGALPIVATDVGGNAEIVSDGVSGRIVKPGDPTRFAEALENVLADPTRARAMGEAAVAVGPPRRQRGADGHAVSGSLRGELNASALARGLSITICGKGVLGSAAGASELIRPLAPA